MQNYKNLGFWTLWYRYHYVWYRYQTHFVWWYRYHLPWYQYQLGSVWWYRYHLVLVPVPLRGFAQKCCFLPSLVPFFFIQLLHSIIPQKPTWNLTQNNSTALELVIWNLLIPTLGKNSNNSTQGPPIHTNHINMMDSIFILYQLGFDPHNFNNSRVWVISPQNPRKG